jgi:cytochrome c-type biogenesis protein CcmF
MSVGRPYFDRMAVPIGVALLLLMGVGPALPWGRATPEQVKRALVPPLFGALLGAALGAMLGVRAPWTLVALAFGGYTAQVTLRELWLPVARRRAQGAALGQALVESPLRGRRRTAAYVVHAGAALAVVAIAVSSTMGTSKELQLREGETVTLGAYSLTFLKAEEVREPHREAVVARIRVARGGRELGEMTPRMNHYDSQREPVGTPAVRTGMFEDLYLSVMNIDAAAGTLGLLAMVNPMVAWIWGATAIMALGGLAALWPGHRTAAAAARVTAHPAAVSRVPAEG